MLIHASVRALVSVAIGRRLIVWGGHPAITPMIWAAAEDLGVPYEDAVTLYQSTLFEEDFPEENRRFRNLVLVEQVQNSREKSLRLMREKMLTDFSFDAGVFIGGMDGLIEEYRMFRNLHPNALVLPVVASGGAASLLPEMMGLKAGEFQDTIDFIRLFHNQLGIDPNESRRT